MRYCEEYVWHERLIKTEERERRERLMKRIRWWLLLSGAVAGVALWALS
jgi:NO-binding membrane sensor protein with MHYT domain